ncbi:MAG: hemerythrin domain-containing protein [Pseudomonadales bacterium]
MPTKAKKKQDINRQKVMRRLHDEHTYIGKLRKAMSVEINKLKRSGVVDVVVLRDMMRYLMEYPDVHHHPLEDRVFEKLAAYDGAVRSEVLELLAEHKDLARESQYLYHKLDAIVHGTEKIQKSLLRASLVDFLELYGEHVRREESIVFPAAEEMLSNKQWRDIARHLPKVDDPVFGENNIEKFARLRRQIADNADIAAASVAMSEMVGVYAVIGAVGALSEGTSELMAFNRQQIRDFRKQNVAVLTEADSASAAIAEAAKVNARLISRGVSHRLGIAAKTLRAAYLPISEGLEVVTSIGK